MKTTTIIAKSLLATLLLFSPLLNAQYCQKCVYNADRDQYSCANDCIYNGWGCGGCCHLNAGHTECYVGGCCLYNPQSGGLCYDKTGASCGNFSCSQIGLPLLGSPDATRTVLSNVYWVTDKEFAGTIGKYSKSFETAVASFQALVTDSPKESMKEYDSRKFAAVLRPHFPAEITVTHAGGSDWVIHLNKADTELEGPRAPNMLEIVGDHWTLVSHQDHPQDQPAQKYEVASGDIR